MFYCVSQEIWLEDWWKLVCIDQDPYLQEIPKIFNMTWKYFCVFNNVPSGDWVADIEGDFLTCYSCLYHRFVAEITPEGCQGNCQGGKEITESFAEANNVFFSLNLNNYLLMTCELKFEYCSFSSKIPYKKTILRNKIHSCLVWWCTKMEKKANRLKHLSAIFYFSTKW